MMMLSCKLNTTFVL